MTAMTTSAFAASFAPVNDRHVHYEKGYIQQLRQLLSFAITPLLNSYVIQVFIYY